MSADRGSDPRRFAESTRQQSPEMAEWRWAHLQFRIPVWAQLSNETWAGIPLGLSVPVSA
jgi:hypothetical protein